MSFRTDMAIELEKCAKSPVSGIRKSEKKIGDVSLCEIEIESLEGERALSKPRGIYITAEFENILKVADYSEIEQAFFEGLNRILPKKREKILVVGLGNKDITCDSIGPLTASKILATRHISKEFAKQIGLEGIKNVSVITPNVLGKTGLEAGEMIEGIKPKINPDAVIAIDALTAGSISRLFRSVQLCNTGISPGSGVKNSRKELSEKTLGVPVIAVGVPTVVQATTLAFELTGKEPNLEEDMIVSPKDCDLLCHRISEILANVLNKILQPQIPPHILCELV